MWKKEQATQLRRWALVGIDAEIERLNTQREALLKRESKKRVARRTASPNNEPTPTPEPVERKKRTMSPEARKKMSEMMKARWASRRGKKK